MDSHVFTPIYYRIEKEILDQIQQGRLQPGTQLPSEAELAQQHGVSRITARRVLDDLVHLGRAFRQQGKGTFVALPRIREISGFGSFSEDVTARGLRPSSHILLFKEMEPEPSIRQKLHIGEAELVYCLKRLRLANEEPVAVETAYLPCRLCPGLINEDLASGSLYDLLRQKYGMVPRWADAEIEAAPAAQEEAHYLELKPGEPVLIAQRVTCSETYNVIEVVRSVYRGDRFTFYTGRQHIS